MKTGRVLFASLVICGLALSAIGQECPVTRLSCPTTYESTFANILGCNHLSGTTLLYQRYFDFQGKSGDSITIKLISSSPIHIVQLLSPSGSFITQGSAGVTATFSSSGTYKIVLADTTRDAPYKLTLECGSADPVQTLAVVGSTAGSGGSFFRTSVQLHNPEDVSVQGSFVYHPAGVAGTSSDPAAPYNLAPRETLAVSDLLPSMGQSGLGSLDLVASSGKAPLVVARVFNDAGAAGTSGMGVEFLKPEEALWQGDSGYLVVPPDLTKSRFNIGIRTLSLGAKVEITVRNAAGSVVSTQSKTFASTYFAQTSAADFCGTTLIGNESIRLRITEGSAFVYGSATDNNTQDPTIQYAKSR